MGESATPEQDDKFDKFELVTAILLGLTAIGAALAGLQAGQWGGKQLEAFSAANTLTTKAATQYTEDTVLMNADYAAVAAAKSYILMARDAKGTDDEDRNLDLANYQYSSQLTERAYKTMGLPLDYYIEDEDEEGEDEAAAAPAADGAAPAAAAEPDEPEVDIWAALERGIPDETLYASLGHELDEDYVEETLATGKKMFDEADKKFEEGRVANNNGDQFDLAVVFFTVALFFAGLGLVFKTDIRWGFCAVGALIFVGTSLFIATLPWAG